MTDAANQRWSVKHMNPVVNQAVSDINEGKVNQAKAKASILISNIDAEQKSSAHSQQVIVEQRSALARVSGDVFTVESVFGGPVPVGANQETMVKVIEDINKARQSVIASSTRNIAQAIVNAQESIRQSGERIAKYREELAKVQPETVTATEVAGN